MTGSVLRSVQGVADDESLPLCQSPFKIEAFALGLAQYGNRTTPTAISGSISPSVLPFGLNDDLKVGDGIVTRTETCTFISSSSAGARWLRVTGFDGGWSWELEICDIGRRLLQWEMKFTAGGFRIEIIVLAAFVSVALDVWDTDGCFRSIWADRGYTSERHESVPLRHKKSV